MDPFSLGIAIAAFVGTLVVALIALTIKKLIEWFKARKKIPVTDQDRIGVILTQRMNNHKYVEVPGVFNRKYSETQLVQAIYDRSADKIVDARAISSGEIEDEELLRLNDKGDGMIIFT